MLANISCRKLYIGLVIIGLGATSSVMGAEDKLEPLALRTIMSDMGENMQAITDGISLENWQQVEKNAALIADHPQPPMAEKKRIMSLFGAKMAEFKTLDGKTHDAARVLSEVSKRADGFEIIAAFTQLQNTCLTCHVKFRKSFQAHFYKSTTQ